MEIGKPDQIGEVGEAGVGPLTILCPLVELHPNRMTSLFRIAPFMLGGFMLTGCGLIPKPTSQATILPPVQTEAAWSRFTSTRGGYSIDFPGSPQEKDNSVSNAQAFDASIRVSGPVENATSQFYPLLFSLEA